MIYWDLGNVLFKFYNDDFKIRLESLVTSNDKKTQFSLKYDKVQSDSFVGKVNYNQTIKLISEITGLNLVTIQSLAKNYRVEINSELFNHIKNDTMHRHGIISDLHQIAYRAMVDRYPDFLSHFSSPRIFLSNRTGLTKRGGGLKYFSKIFIKDNEDIVYVDDDIINLDIAKRLKAITVVFPRKETGKSWSRSNKCILKDVNVTRSLMGKK